MASPVDTKDVALYYEFNSFLVSHDLGIPGWGTKAERLPVSFLLHSPTASSPANQRSGMVQHGRSCQLQEEHCSLTPRNGRAQNTLHLAATAGVCLPKKEAGPAIPLPNSGLPREEIGWLPAHVAT